MLGETKVGVEGRSWPATHVDMGNPHAVAFVDDLADAGRLLDPPSYDAGDLSGRASTSSSWSGGAPATSRCGCTSGARRDPVVRHRRRRGHGRGRRRRRATAAARTATYRVDVPGGRSRVTWTADDRVLLAGPAVIVGPGTTSL